MRNREDDSAVHADGLIDVDLELDTEDFRANLSEVLSKVASGERRVLVTSNGRPLAVILPVADARHYAELVDADDRAAVEAVEEASGAAR